MRSADAAAALAALLLAACGGGGGGGGTPNDVPLSVDGLNCDATLSAGYPNKPCVTVTVCTPGTGQTQCQRVNDVLLDTGSYGLRLFKQVVTVPLTQVSSGAGALASCAQFGDGSADWGPVMTATVRLGNAPGVTTPIQVIDSTYASAPAGCANLDTGPSQALFNGILGVGVFQQDCGEPCVTDDTLGFYYSCVGTTCTGATAPLADQLQNPVSLLPGDGNGLVVSLPAVAAGGTGSVEGSVLLGIGTHSDNGPGTARPYPVDPGIGTLTTRLTTAGGTTDIAGSFLDTGSNGYFFAPPAASGLTTCPVPDDAWYCNTPALALSAANAGTDGTHGPAVGFLIGDYDQLLSSPTSAVFVDIGGTALPGDGFDWGLPFYLGRKVFVGIEQRSSSLGTGPYVAY